MLAVSSLQNHLMQHGMMQMTDSAAVTANVSGQCQQWPGHVDINATAAMFERAINSNPLPRFRPWHPYLPAAAGHVEMPCQLSHAASG